MTMGLTRVLLISLLLLLLSGAPPLRGEPTGTRPLIGLGKFEIHRVVPPDATLLDEPAAIERFLAALDGAPPNWVEVFGHHGGGHDERLFTLNRERDQARTGKPALAQRVTFLWEGELSTYDAKRGGYRVAIGPKLIRTAWGLVRFKPEGLPSELIAGPPPALNAFLKRKIAAGETIAIAVAVTGRLVPEESVIYDMAHGEEGRGLVMPVVQVERLDYLYFQE
ncbi:hypothetical protein [Nitrospira sp. Kam-Ns4a]